MTPTIRLVRKSVEDGGEHVPPGGIGAEPMDIAAGTDLAGLEPGIEQVERFLIIGILRRHERRQERHEDHHTTTIRAATATGLCR